MARRTTTPSTCSPPIPLAQLLELEERLSALPTPVSLDGWDECPPQVATPSPVDITNPVPGAWFDVEAVVRVVRALCELRHTKGRWARRPLIPDPWQIVWVIAPVFGWRYALTDPDPELAGTRIVRSVYVEIPRKNGKSTLSSGLALILLVADGEAGGEVYAAASSRDQARIVFDEAKKMAQAAPLLHGKVTALASLLRVPKTGSFFRVLSRVAEAAHGLNVHGAVIDELHVHRTRDLVDAIETGTGARTQPLVIVITTADQGEAGTIYEEKHERTRKVAGRIVRDPSWYGVIWAAAREDDPFAEATWRKCNPGLGTTVTLAYLRKEAEKARTEPSYFPTFCRLHLNRRERQQSRWLSLTDWDLRPNVQPVCSGPQLSGSGSWDPPDALLGAECYAGLDLSATTDLTALLVGFPDVDHEELAVVPFFWIPEAGLDARIERDQVPYDRWAAEGWLRLTEGNVVDYDEIIGILEDVAETCDLRTVGHDRWQAGPVVQALTKLGIEAIPVPQTYQGMSAAAKELERLTKQGRFQHGGHPVLRWNADCVEVIRDNADNIKPVKPDRQKSVKRVDGISAGVMMVDAWMRRQPAKKTAVTAPSAPPPAGASIYRPQERLAALLGRRR